MQLNEHGAVISECGRWRYELTRKWDEAVDLHFIMLNPSTADADIDDPTIRKCIGFARIGGFGGIRIVNLFAHRATNPKELLTCDYSLAVGPENDAHIRKIPARSTIVAAWGSFPYDHNALYRRIDEVKMLTAGGGMRWTCVKKSGVNPVVRPWHPLYVKYGDLIEL